jgi:hypothetical protein
MLDLFLPSLTQYFFIFAGVFVTGIVYMFYRHLCTIDESMSFGARPLPSANRAADRRTSNRVPSRALLGLKAVSGSGVAGTATLRDLSKTGACFESSVLLKPKQKIQTRMRAHNQESILELSAQVVWIKPGQSSHLYGVHFLSL